MNVFLYSEHNHNFLKLLYRSRILLQKPSIKNIMRIGTATITLLITTSVQLLFALPAKSQPISKVEITLELNNETLVQAFQKIEAQSPFHFMYRNKEVKGIRNLKIKGSKQSVEDFLRNILAGTSLAYRQVNNQILIEPVKNNPENLTALSISEYQKLQYPPAANIVTGQVINSKGEPLAGVSVTVKGAVSGTSTDGKGNYSINVPANGTLIFSYVGYATREIPVNGRTLVDVTMEESVSALDQVVVVGYGTQKRRLITGAISDINANELTDIPVGQTTQKIQGKVAGVQINTSSGNPGKDIAIRIRGAASINAGNNPLYVIDGLPIVEGLSNINPNEIENISVLKGPSASSLYGSRAANGVVLVTTKRAKSGQNVVQFNATVGVSAVPKKGRYELMSAKELLQYMKEFYEDKIKYEGFTGEIPALYQHPESYEGKDTNWYDETLRPASQSSYNLSFLSNKGKFSSATTLGYYKEDGVVINSAYQRFSLRSNNSYELNDHIKVGFNVAPSYQTFHNINGKIHVDQGPETQGPGETEGFLSLLYGAIVTPPIFSPDDTNPDGSTKLRFTAPGLFTFPNWKKTLQDRSDKSRSIGLLSNAYVEVDFMKNFLFKSSLSADLNNNERRTFYPSTTGTLLNPPPILATGSHATNNARLWMFENTLTFDKTIANNHNVELMGGYSVQEYEVENSEFSGNQFPDDMVPWLSAAANITGWSNTQSGWSLISMYSRLNYNYKKKYLLTASIRRDGSSRFGSDNRWGDFPSVSAGWIVSEENFMKDLSIVSFMKLRAEYGATGNFNIGDYSQFANISPSNYVFGNSLVSGRSPSSIGNRELTWETTNGMDVGLDIAFFNNRVAFTFDFYKKSTASLLYQTDIPAGTGFLNIQSNIGQFDFWGYEFALSTKNLVGQLKWNTDLNISLSRNKVIKLGTNDQPIGATTAFNASNASRTAVGHPIGQIFGYVSDGVYMTQEEFDSQPKSINSKVGTARFKDISGPNGVPDGKIDVNDRTFIGNPTPRFIFGMTNTFSYKRFDLNIIMAGAYKQDKIIAIESWTRSTAGNFNIQKIMKDRWRSIENPGAGIIGRTLSGTATSGNAQSNYVDDASYLTIKNIALGYTLPTIKYIRSARIFASIQQALVFTKYRGSNPETSVWGLNGLNEGLDGGMYPVPRVFALGVNFNF